NYGTEIIGQTALLAAAHDTFNIYGNHTHGTHVAGIAAGNGGGTKYVGVAPEAELVFVSLLVDEASVMDAYIYLFNYAKSTQKRLVVNMSWGLYHMGTLDGTSLLSSLLDSLSIEGVVFVSSAGNNGDVKFHIKKNFLNIQDTLKTRIEFDNWSGANNLWGSAIIIWGNEQHSFKTALQFTNASNQQLHLTDFLSNTDNLNIDTFLIQGNDTILFKIVTEDYNVLNNKPHTLIKIHNPKTGTYKVNLFVIADSGNVHLWNVAELTTGVGNWGLDFSAPIPGFIEGDNDYGISEPACTKNVITVGAYKTQITLTNGNQIGGYIAAFSSKGPTIDERIKPDITAPGISIISAMSSYYTGDYITSISITFNGRIYRFSSLSGTSMSSPVVAGVAALILEANPWLSALQVKEIIKNTARTDNYTGIIPVNGSNIWGKGKINALKSVQKAINDYAYIDDEKINNNEILIYPNPVNDKLYITTNNLIKEVYLYNYYGQLLKNYKISNKITNIEINTNDLNPGMYLIITKFYTNYYSLKKIIKL
ncbi:MAG TPA: S8 family serine peptidase, partial [Bacteroidales bacterium]|nr:S8 family serine peptidase [Bacteroidales bacterium]